jgi:TRAP transporter 4TM/12TM fusion protein
MTDQETSQAVPRLSRPLNGLVSVFATLLTLGSIGWAADIYTTVGLQLYNEQFLAAMLGIVLPMTYLHVPMRKHRQGKLPWYDAVAALMGFTASWYVAVDFPRLANEIAYRPLDAVIISVVLLLLILEGVRRAVGKILVIILLLFFAYAMFGNLIPGQLAGRNLQLDDLLIGLALDPQALFGIALKIGTTVVISFLFLGHVLFLSGGSDFFTGIAMSTMGRYRGGAAKVAIAASSLFGSISGSAVSNVVSTGVITIPLMRETGYTAETAGAIEAVASTGGQLMPPLMGATAFVMAELLEIPYADVVLAALIPAFLYYLALFVVTDLEAAKTGIARLAVDTLPKVMPILKAGWFFPLPFVALIYSLFGLNVRPEEAALYAVLVLLACSMIFGHKGKRVGPMTVLKGLEDTGRSCIELMMIVAVAGLMIGLLNISGLGFALTYTLGEIGGGNLAILLILAAMICIVLGMGMPTLGVYVLVAALVAPSLIELGVSKMAAHLFVLYFGMMSMITPPMAIAAFAAATLTRADPMRTGFAAVRIGWVAYIIPFLFILSPGLLMAGGAMGIIVALVGATIGVWLGSVGLVGYFVRPLSWTQRAIFMASGFLAMLPAEAFAAGLMLKLVGIVVGAAMVFTELSIRRRAAAAAE